MRFGSLSFFCTKAYFKGGSLLQAPFSTPPKDGGHDRVYLGVITCELFLAPTLPAKKKREKYACETCDAYWLVPSLLIFFLKRLRNSLASSPRHWPPPALPSGIHWERRPGSSQLQANIVSKVDTNSAMTLLSFLQRKKHEETFRLEHILLCIYNTKIPVQLFTTNYYTRFILILFY